MEQFQTALRIGVLVQSFICMGLASPSLLWAWRGRKAPITGLGLGVLLVFTGQFWFQLGYLLTGVPDVFRPWNVIALVALNAGSAVYIVASIMDRREWWLK